MRFGKTFISVAIVLLLSYFAIQPFFVDGFFPMHDDTQVVRVAQMAKAIADGHLPVRWVKDLGYGYGYPLFNFYAPLAYYIGALINVFGFDALLSTKAMMIIGILLSGVSMYFLAREFWGKSGGIIAGLFYMYAPYHALDIYVRGAVGEFWAYAFLPLMAYGFYKRNVFVGALGFAGVILSHNLTAMMIVPFLIIVLLLYCFIAYRRKNPCIIYHLSFIIFLGLGISAFYWLPAILELGFTNVQSQIGGGADFRDHFVCWQQLWDSHWGFGGSTAGCDLDGLSLKIGKLHVTASLAALVGGLYFWKKHKLQSKVVLLATGFWLLAAFMTIELSRPIWGALQPLAYLQYPWRFLLLISFFSSFLAGSIVWFLSKSRRISLVTTAILLALLLYGNQKLFQPHYIETRSSNDFTRKENITWVTSRISDEYMPKDFLRPTDEIDTVKRRVQVGEIKVDKTQELIFKTNEPEAKPTLISIAPFPAWKAFIDGNAVSYATRPNGIELTIPPGFHTVKLSYVSTPSELLGNVISIISIAILISGILSIRAGRKTRFPL